MFVLIEFCDLSLAENKPFLGRQVVGMSELVG